MTGTRGLFLPGPAALPLPVLEQAQAELDSFRGSGISILELSHRSDAYQSLNVEVQQGLKALLGLDDRYDVLLLAGGASLQFAMLPMNFLHPGAHADYLLTGSWSEKAYEAAKPFGAVRIGGSTASVGYRRVLVPQEVHTSPDATYVHLTSNETIHGVQWQRWPEVAVPLVADMTSDLLSRRIDAGRFHFIYASAQKNLGIAGLTVCIFRTEWLSQAIYAPPGILQYNSHAREQSCFNTPPIVAVYLLSLMLRWIYDLGGLDVVETRNQAKARQIYKVIDASEGFYQGWADSDSRSQQNITFQLATPNLERKFLSGAEAAGLHGLAGHRSVRGIRVSLYHGVSLEDCVALGDFMHDFQQHVRR